MKKIIPLLLNVTLLSFGVNYAHAECVAPHAPDTPSAKPSLPICLVGYKSTGTHDCSSTETDKYVDEVNKYMKKLSAYAADAITYANAVQQYAKCSAEEAKEGLK